MSLPYPLTMAATLGAIMLFCAIVLTVPKFVVLGAILVTGFLGGAIALHFRLGEVGSSTQLICLGIGIVMWVGSTFATHVVARFFRWHPQHHPRGRLPGRSTVKSAPGRSVAAGVSQDQQHRA